LLLHRRRLLLLHQLLLVLRPLLRLLLLVILRLLPFAEQLDWLDIPSLNMQYKLQLSKVELHLPLLLAEKIL
jgi:hypothetical protein